MTRREAGSIPGFVGVCGSLTQTKRPLVPPCENTLCLLTHSSPLAPSRDAGGKTHLRWTGWHVCDGLTPGLTSRRVVKSERPGDARTAGEPEAKLCSG